MLFSIIVASYNYEKYIGETLSSLENQTFKDFEVIIVDDGSQDNSIKIINDFVTRNPNFKLFTHPNSANKGLAETIKLGIEMATGEYISFCESDDFYDKNNLQIKKEAIENYPNIMFYANGLKQLSSKSEAMKAKYRQWYLQRQTEKCRKYSLKNDAWLGFLNECMFPSFLSVTAKKSLFASVNFNTPVKPFLDFWLWRQIIFSNKFYFIDKEIAYWRFHSDSYCYIYSNNYSNRDAKKNLIKKSNRLLIRKNPLRFLAFKFSAFFKLCRYALYH